MKISFPPWFFLFDSVETGPGAIVPPSLGKALDTIDPENNCRSYQLRKKSVSHIGTDSGPSISRSEMVRSSNRFRLERFGKAMSGTGSWEVPGAVLNGKDWIQLAFSQIYALIISLLHRLWLEFSTSWKHDRWRWGWNRLYKYAPCFSLFFIGWRWNGPKIHYPGSSCGSRNGWKGTYISIQCYFRWRWNRLGERNAQNYWNRQSHSKASHKRRRQPPWFSQY